MRLLEKLQFHLWDASGMVAGLIETWSPENCKTERSYEQSLYSFLHENLEDVQVTKQFARGRIRADLVVGDKVILEIKNNLDSTGKYQRLLGQLTEYKNWKGSIIIVLCGRTDPNLRKELNRFLRRESMSREQVRVLEKQGLNDPVTQYRIYSDSDFQ